MTAVSNLIAEKLASVADTYEGRRDFFAGLPIRVKREYEIEQAWQDMFRPEFNRKLVERAKKRMARVDALHPTIRAVVHEFGLEIVHVFMEHGIRSAENLRFLIGSVLNAEEPRSKSVMDLFRARGVKESSICFLIDTALGADYENGCARFRFNTSPSRKQNSLVADDDDEAYFVLGPVVSGSVAL